jgi:hypothetical protein
LRVRSQRRDSPARPWVLRGVAGRSGPGHGNRTLPGETIASECRSIVADGQAPDARTEKRICAIDGGAGRFETNENGLVRDVPTGSTDRPTSELERVLQLARDVDDLLTAGRVAGAHGVVRELSEALKGVTLATSPELATLVRQ